MLKQLHDFICTNYEQGNYQAAEIQYQQWKDLMKIETDDYQLGYENAYTDYRNHRSFRDYPVNVLDFAHRTSPVTDFIRGYNLGKKSILET